MFLKPDMSHERRSHRGSIMHAAQLYFCARASVNYPTTQTFIVKRKLACLVDTISEAGM